MKKNLTIEDFTPREIKTNKGVEVVTWDELKLKMGKREFEKFEKWMFCQTCTPHGVYPWDLQRYLAGKDSFRL